MASKDPNDCLSGHFNNTAVTRQAVESKENHLQYAESVRSLWLQRWVLSAVSSVNLAYADLPANRTMPFVEDLLDAQGL